MTARELTILSSARAEVRRMHGALALTPIPTVPRAHCVDCEAVVILMGDGACPCGSRSVVPMGRRAA